MRDSGDGMEYHRFFSQGRLRSMRISGDRCSLLRKPHMECGGWTALSFLRMAGAVRYSQMIG